AGSLAKTSSAMAAQKCLPVDEMTRARVAPSSLRRRTASRTSGKKSSVMVFMRSGRLSFMCATPSSCESSKNSLWSFMASEGEVEDKSLETHDGLALRGREWPLAEVRGTIVVVHGLGEHIGRYAHVADFIVARGWRVVGYDQRGHGRSGGERGRLRSADDLLVDLARVIDAVRVEHPGPLVLLGHSMGGLVAARFVAGAPAPGWARAVDALVLSSPALDAGMTAVQKAMLAVLGPIAPNLGVGNGLSPRWISRDAAVVPAYEADPLVQDRIAPRLARFIVDGGETVRALAPRWAV